MKKYLLFTLSAINLVILYKIFIILGALQKNANKAKKAIKVHKCDANKDKI